MVGKTVIVLGRGIEGCGVTKFALEQYDWLINNGYDCKVYAAKDKTWSRKKSHDTAFVELVKFAKKDELDKMIKECNEVELVFINSLPPISVSADVIDGFNRFLNEVRTKMILIQHDHSSLSIKRNACLDESINRCEVIFAHSDTNDFSMHVESVLGLGGLASLFSETPTKTIQNFQPGMNFDRVRDKYWKDISQQNAKHHKWIGRTTSWKGYKQMFQFHNEYLSKQNYLTTFEGIERSPAYLDFRKLTEFNDFVATGAEIADTDLSDAYGGLANVFGPYINDDMLERMSKVGFGYQLSILKNRFIQRSIEYTHCELVCAGVVPVYRKRYGELCTHRATGKKLIDHSNTGTVWLDDDNMQPALDLIKELTENAELRDKYRKDAYEFYKSHQDSQYTFAEMMSRIENNI